MINEWKHSQRQKRGGGQAHFSLDEEVAEGRYQHEPVENFTPEKAFERRWAETLLERVLDRLRDEWEVNTTREFVDLKPFLLDGKGTTRIADVAIRLGITEASLKWAVRKLRQRYREIFREEIAHTVSRQLLQEIGEGGFGTVWMAEQMEPVTRRVALKIIKLGMDTREVIARFEAERQALAMMDHPNIARVLDAGATDKGRPYFVMELVKGIPITTFCVEKQLGTRERLLLFGEVCSAINHAHQKGIIHRDIKPSNVMVTLHGDKAVVKVIDFGIAKAIQGRLTDKTLFTRFDQFIGTPVYMSPEQAALSGLDIDTRSDIYALGILLYEMLIGKPPFDAKSLAAAGHDEMLRIIREVEPAKPSSRLSTVFGDERTTIAKARDIAPDKLRRLVEQDLDWIVMKAIEKDRTRRYELQTDLATQPARRAQMQSTLASSYRALGLASGAFQSTCGVPGIAKVERLCL